MNDEDYADRFHRLAYVCSSGITGVKVGFSPALGGIYHGFVILAGNDTGGKMGMTKSVKDLLQPYSCFVSVRRTD